MRKVDIYWLARLYSPEELLTFLRCHCQPEISTPTQPQQIASNFVQQIFMNEHSTVQFYITAISVIYIVVRDFDFKSFLAM